MDTSSQTLCDTRLTLGGVFLNEGSRQPVTESPQMAVIMQIPRSRNTPSGSESLGVEAWNEYFKQAPWVILMHAEDGEPLPGASVLFPLPLSYPAVKVSINFHSDGDKGLLRSRIH